MRTQKDCQDNMKIDHPTRQLCERIVATDFQSLDAPTVAKVKEAIIDGLAVALAGCKQKPVAILADYVRKLGAAPVASVWGLDFKTSVVSAAFVNAAAVHVLDYEPMSLPSTHAVSPVLPAVIALAETASSSGRDIITACAKGFEMQQRILYCATPTPRAQQRFHQLGMVGVMGSAVAAAHMLGLDSLQTCNTVGMAASRAGAVLGNAGSMTKCSHAGNAAAAGLEAALLSQCGFDANPDILEHEKGYVAAFCTSGPFDYEKFLEFGKPFRVVEPGMAYKFFPSKYPTQFAISAALELHKQIGDPARIARVELTTPVMHDVDRPDPKSGLEGKFSFQYTTAVALLDGKIRIDSFSDQRRFSPDVVALLPRVKVIPSKDITEAFHKMHVELMVETTDGKRYKTECRKPMGFWGVAIKPEEHRVKIQDCMSQVLDDKKIEEIVKLTAALETLEADGVKRLISMLKGNQGAR